MTRWAGALLVAGAIGTWVAGATQVRVGSIPEGPRGPDEERGAHPAISWSVAGAMRGTPAIDEGTVYAQSRGGELVAVDRARGSIRWRQRTSPPGFDTAGSAVRLWRGLVVAGDEDLVAFEAATGARAWRFSPADGYGVGHYLGAVVDGVVTAGSPAGRIYAVDFSTGRLRWSALADEGPATVYEPVAGSGLVVAGFNVFTAPITGGVLAVDAVDGRERWRRPLRARDGSAYTDGFGGGITIAGDVVIVTARDGAIWGLSAIDGTPLWHLDDGSGACVTETGRPDLRPLTHSGSQVIAGSSTGCVTSFDLRSRQRLWRYTDPRLGSTTFRIASDDWLAYVPFFSGRLVAIDLRTGLERWRVGDESREFVWAPALAARRLYLTSPAGVFAYTR